MDLLFSLRSLRCRRIHSSVRGRRSEEVIREDTLVEDRKREVARRVIDGDAGPETKKLLWESALDAFLAELEKGKDDIDMDAKSADWKVAVSAALRQTVRCQSKWVSERLSMGAEAGVSHGLRQLREGKRPKASRILERLISSFKS